MLTVVVGTATVGGGATGIVNEMELGTVSACGTVAEAGKGGLVMMMTTVMMIMIMMMMMMMMTVVRPVAEEELLLPTKRVPRRAPVREAPRSEVNRYVAGQTGTVAGECKIWSQVYARFQCYFSI